MTTKNVVQQTFGLLWWLGLCFIVAAIGAIASIDAKQFYAQLVQPSWAPPGWLFAPVWSALYTLMGLAAWRVWCVGGAAAKMALLLFVVQLVVNGLWSWLFFKFHLGAISFIEVLLLWALIAATIRQFWRVQPLAAYLLIPYLLWVTFAACLNWAMWQGNPLVLG